MQNFRALGAPPPTPQTAPPPLRISGYASACSKETSKRSKYVQLLQKTEITKTQIEKEQIRVCCKIALD